MHVAIFFLAAKYFNQILAQNGLLFIFTHVKKCWDIITLVSKNSAKIAKSPP